MDDTTPLDDDSDPARLLAEDAPGDNSGALSVTELSARLKRHVESGFGWVRIRGEISGWKRVASGHCYLALKDDGALIDGVMWKGNAARLPFSPEDGLEVIASGKLTIYPSRSKYQIVIERLELAGAGALLALFEKLKAKLAGEGLFDAGAKRVLPYLPRTIGVVTSPTGAVIRDILHRLSDRFPVHVIVWPVIVQGQGAAAAVAAAVEGFSAMPANGPIARPDLVIVARGGGSIEDLWAFNEEPVARAVAASTIPVISAVGHETDTTLCDFAADLRAPTPTAAAELAVPVRAELAAGIATLSARSLRAVRRYHERAEDRFRLSSQRLPRVESLYAPQRQLLDDMSERLKRGLAQRLAEARAEVARASGALRPAQLNRRLEGARQRLTGVRLEPRLLTRPLAEKRDALDRLWRLASTLHPDAPLKRGYALVSAAGHVVTSATAARGQPALTLRFADGALDVSTGTPPPVERKRAVRYPPPGQASLFDAEDG